MQQRMVKNSMDKIRTAAVFGAGAIGAYMIWGLMDKLGSDNLFVVANGERRERLQKEGLCINGQPYELNVKTPEQAHGVDLLIVGLKYDALKASLSQIAEVCDKHTVVMSLMNGVDSEEQIGTVVDPQQIIYSLIRIASRRVGQEIRFQPPTGARMGILFGEKETGEVTQRMQSIAELFDGTGINYHFSKDIVLDIWLKYASNICMNLPQAVLNVGIGANTDSEYVKDLEKKLNDEVIRVAKAKGIHMEGIDETSFRKGFVPDPKTRYSTLQDLDAGRHTEIEMFSGTLIRMGREAGVPTPYNEIIYDCIKALEEKNDGKFDYQ